jgi:hypothetical protein
MRMRVREQTLRQMAVLSMARVCGRAVKVRDNFRPDAFL